MQEQMQKSLDSLRGRLAKIRAGRVNLDVLDDIRVEYYGSLSPINQVASLSISDARTIVIDPWEKSMVSTIVKAIQRSDLDINPTDDGKVVRLIFPPLTEERRLAFVKLAKKELEECKISLRNIRQKLNSAIKSGDFSEDQKKIEEKRVQKMLDEYVKKAEEIFVKKEREILG